MKKLLLAAILGVSLAATNAAYAFTFDPPSGSSYLAQTDVTCADPDNEYTIYAGSTKAMIEFQQGCPGAFLPPKPGTYLFVEYDPFALETAEGDDIYDLLVTDAGFVAVQSYQANADFSGASADEVSQQLTEQAYNGFVGSVGTFLVETLPVVLGILAALIGLGFLIRHVSRWIGRKA